MQICMERFFLTLWTLSVLPTSLCHYSPSSGSVPSNSGLPHPSPGHIDRSAASAAVAFPSDTILLPSGGDRCRSDSVRPHRPGEPASPFSGRSAPSSLNIRPDPLPCPSRAVILAPFSARSVMALSWDVPRKAPVQEYTGAQGTSIRPPGCGTFSGCGPCREACLQGSPERRPSGWRQAALLLRPDSMPGPTGLMPLSPRRIPGGRPPHRHGSP